MLSLLGPESVARCGEGPDSFRAAEPFPHLVVDGFFAPGFAAALTDEFPPFERGSCLNEQGRPGGKSAVEGLVGLGGAFARVDELFRSSDFLLAVSAVTGIPDLLHDPDYHGGGTHENRAGQELDPHVDFNYHPRTGFHRRLNVIVYLNPEREESYGARASCTRTPGLSRRSVALHLDTRERPPEETAPPHSTVYVERPLPFVLHAGARPAAAHRARLSRALVRRRQHLERLSAREDQYSQQTATLLGELLGRGAPLSPEDVALVERAVAREDARLRALYDREKAFTADIVALEARLRELPADAAAPPEALCITGRDSDLWCGRTVTVELSPGTSARILRIRGAVPAAHVAGLGLRAEVAGAPGCELLARPGGLDWAIPLGPAAARGEGARVTLTASGAFRPAETTPGSGDQRALAFQLLDAEIE